VVINVAGDAAGIGVPPLILQPLVENAVRHGVATLIEGGEIRVDATITGPRLFVVVSNPYDPDSRRRGTGLGLENVRRRLAATFGERAAIAAEAGEGRYRVSLTIPVEKETEITS
jgi:LytS/YehU family sensor histidine kinase